MVWQCNMAVYRESHLCKERRHRPGVGKGSALREGHLNSTREIAPLWLYWIIELHMLLLSSDPAIVLPQLHARIHPMRPTK